MNALANRSPDSGSSENRLGVRFLIFTIELYRNLVSPLRPPSCRFYPTCSRYAIDALAEFGVVRGVIYAVVRLLKCGPWHRGGWDPIPERCSAVADNGGCGEAPKLGESELVV